MLALNWEYFCWNAPTFAPWLEESLQRASQAAFGQAARAYGEGGTIPFMGMLGNRFPHAQFVITGVLGPGANAHGPNEFLHLPTGKKVTEAVATMLAAHGVPVVDLVGGNQSPRVVRAREALIGAMHDDDWRRREFKLWIELPDRRIIP